MHPLRQLQQLPLVTKMEEILLKMMMEATSREALPPSCLGPKAEARGAADFQALKECAAAPSRKFARRRRNNEEAN